MTCKHVIGFVGNKLVDTVYMNSCFGIWNMEWEKPLSPHPMQEKVWSMEKMWKK
jgi:hypothetical protein